jgi:hypothetical protein
MREFRTGILIIGSLSWETGKFNRKAWRADRLDLQSQQAVQTRTRYAWRSATRGNTYTMIFSGSARPSVGIVASFRNLVRCEADLFEEAAFLAAVEGLGASGKWRDFGAVGVLCNPYSSDVRAILQNWPKYFGDRISDHCAATAVRGPGEAPSIQRDGFLNIDWPKSQKAGDSKQL